jgi:hypothetical protein
MGSVPNGYFYILYFDHMCKKSYMYHLYLLAIAVIKKSKVFWTINFFILVNANNSINYWCP